MKRTVCAAALVGLFGGNPYDVSGALAQDGDAYSVVAERLVRATRAAGVRRVAVLSFRGLGGREAIGGKIVSERMIVRLLDGGLQVVERGLLENVLREQKLEATGLIDSGSMRELGRILDVDALIVGTVTPLKGELAEVNARVIAVLTAEVIGAASCRTVRDWPEAMFEDSGWSLSLPEPPAFVSADFVEHPGEPDDCGRSRETADELERALVDLKARYWAQKLRDGLKASSLRRNPGSEISNVEIRSRFHERLQFHVKHPGPPLTDSEHARLRDVARKIAGMSSNCTQEGV